MCGFREEFVIVMSYLISISLLIRWSARKVVPLEYWMPTHWKSRQRIRIIIQLARRNLLPYASMRQSWGNLPYRIQFGVLLRICSVQSGFRLRDWAPEIIWLFPEPRNVWIRSCLPSKYVGRSAQATEALVRVVPHSYQRPFISIKYYDTGGRNDAALFH